MSELKPCPCCGADNPFKRAVPEVGIPSGVSGYRATIKCRDCGCSITRWALEKAWAIESAEAAWNRRAQSANEPLTLEELREMHGEPVWIVPHRGIAKWYLVDVANECCSTCDMDVVDFELYGPKNTSYGWLAYRAKPEPPEGEAND